MPLNWELLGFFTASGPAPKSKQPRSAPLFALGIAFMGTLALILAGSENAWGQRYSWGARNPWVIESETPLEIQEVESFQVGFLGNYLLSHPLRSSKAQAQTLQAVSGTAFVATRLWKGASLHYQAAFLYSESPGMARGLSNPLPGLTYWPLNGSHRIHSPRFYFRQTFAFSARGNRSHENVPAGFNQLGGYEPINYLRIHFGKLDMGDLFDRHLFAPFTPGPFLFGSLQHNGAWDRPQNRLGYTYGLVAELEHQGLNIKAGMATLPEQPRGESMNWNLGGSLAGMVEASHRYHFFAQPGKFALMTYLNTGRFGSFQHALDHALDAEKDPRLSPVRRLGQYKFGFLFHWNQSLNAHTDVFLNLGWNNGKTETAYHVEVDQTLGLGTLLWGNGWKRPQDLLGLGLVANRLSDIHRQYLSWGGKGTWVGEGYLHYGDEILAEAFYRAQPVKSKKLWITADYRLALHPGYQHDEKTLHWLSFRLDVEI